LTNPEALGRSYIFQSQQEAESNNTHAESAVLVFDDETATTNIFLHDDPIFKKIDKLTR
jgi:hypothetical protein